MSIVLGIILGIIFFGLVFKAGAYAGERYAREYYDAALKRMEKKLGRKFDALVPDEPSNRVDTTRNDEPSQKKTD